MKVFNEVKYKKVYLLEKDNKIINFSFEPFSKDSLHDECIQRTEMCALPYDAYYLDKGYEFNITKIVVCNEDIEKEFYSQNEDGFCVLLVYYYLKKNNLWNDNIKIKICKKIYAMDYYFDNDDLYEIPDFIVNMFDKLNDNNLIYFSYLISTCSYHEISSIEELKAFEMVDTDYPDFNIGKYIDERFRLIKDNTCLYECATLKGIKLTEKFINMYNNSEDIDEKIKWAMYFNIFAGFDELLLHKMYLYILNEECLDVVKMIDYFE